MSQGGLVRHTCCCLYIARGVIQWRAARTCLACMQLCTYCGSPACTAQAAAAVIVCVTAGTVCCWCWRFLCCVVRICSNVSMCWCVHARVVWQVCGVLNSSWLCACLCVSLCRADTAFTVCTVLPCATLPRHRWFPRLKVAAVHCHIHLLLPRVGWHYVRVLRM